MKKCFTLIEIVVVIGLMTIMLGVGMISFRQTSRLETVNGSAERIRQKLLLARTNAAANKKDCLCDGADNICANSDDEPLAYWQVTIGSASISVDGACVGGVAFPVPTVEPEAIPAAVTLSVSGPAGVTNYVRFLPSGGGVLPNIPNNQWINIRVTDGTNTRTVRVDGGGEIELL